MKHLIWQALRRALRGSGKVRITFKRQATKYVDRLLWMVRDGWILLPAGCAEKLAIVAILRDWNGDRNRTVMVTITDKFKEDQLVGKKRFIGKLHAALENIRYMDNPDPDELCELYRVLRSLERELDSESIPEPVEDYDDYYHGYGGSL